MLRDPLQFFTDWQVTRLLHIPNKLDRTQKRKQPPARIVLSFANAKAS